MKKHIELVALCTLFVALCVTLYAATQQTSTNKSMMVENPNKGGTSVAFASVSVND